MYEIKHMVSDNRFIKIITMELDDVFKLQGRTAEHPRHVEILTTDDSSSWTINIIGIL